MARRVGRYSGRHTVTAPPADTVVVPPQEEDIVPTYYSVDEPDEDTAETPRASVTPPDSAKADVAPVVREERVSVVAPEAESAPASIDAVPDRLDATGLATFGDAYRIAQERGRADAEEMLDEKDVPLEAREAIRQLEGQHEDELQRLMDVVSKNLVQIAEKGLRGLEGALYFMKNGVPELAMTGLELLDVHTKEKALAAALEIIPMTSLVYAIRGKRLVFDKEKGMLDPQWEDIDKLDRLMYLAGSVFFLGHMFSGARHILVKKGFFPILKKKGFIKAVGAILPAMSKLVGAEQMYARAQQRVLREITKDRSPKRTAPTPEDAPQPPEKDVKTE